MPRWLQAEILQWDERQEKKWDVILHEVMAPQLLKANPNLEHKLPCG